MLKPPEHFTEKPPDHCRYKKYRQNSRDRRDQMQMAPGGAIQRPSTNTIRNSMNMTVAAPAKYPARTPSTLFMLLTAPILWLARLSGLSKPSILLSMARSCFHQLRELLETPLRVTSHLSPDRDILLE